MGVESVERATGFLGDGLTFVGSLFLAVDALVKRKEQKMLSKRKLILRVASKRQVTFPEELLAALQLKQGDEFGVQFVTSTDVRLVPYSRVRRALLTPQVQAAIRRSEAAFNSPQARLVSLEELNERIAGKQRLSKKSAARSRAKSREISVMAGSWLRCLTDCFG